MRVTVAPHPHQHGQLISDNNTKGIQWRKHSISTNGMNNWIYPYAKNSNPYLVPYMEINSKWIIDLKIKPKTIKLGLP